MYIWYLRKFIVDILQFFAFNVHFDWCCKIVELINHTNWEILVQLSYSHVLLPARIQLLEIFPEAIGRSGLHYGHRRFFKFRWWIHETTAIEKYFPIIFCSLSLCICCGMRNVCADNFLKHWQYLIFILCSL